MRRLVVAVLVVSGIVLAGQPAGAQTAPDLGDLFALIDPDGEPCTAVPNQIPGIFDFAAGCVAHDACYEQGADNSACDTAFRRDLLALCVAQHPLATDPLRYVCQGVALLYYMGVIVFGQFT